MRPAAMPARSPPKHRHDGASPLPLGMDWSPPPRKWDGRDTLWPHDPHTGWSFCVMIPSWATRTQQKASDVSSADPVVFYRVVVGVQSPDGISTSRGVFRRFNDFLKLYNVLKRLYPRKNLQQPPPKHRFLRLSSSQALLEERRCSLEDWMGKLLSDIDISRSVPIASFLELEAAARTSFVDGGQHIKSANPDVQNGCSSPLQLQSMSESLYAGSSSTTLNGLSFASDYGSDNTYDTSDVGTPRMGTGNNSEIGSEDLTTDHDLTNTTSIKYGIPNDDTGPFTEGSVLEQTNVSRDRSKKENNVVQRESLHGDTSMDLLSDLERVKGSDHVRRMSSESVGSDVSSGRSSERSNSRMPNSCDHLIDLPGSLEAVGLHILNNVEFVLPLDQRNKMNRVLATMQRRLTTAKTDMEDLIARLNQETAAKEYLITKVRELDVELETTKQRSKENLHQAVLIERERITQMQWDMEEIRRKSMEMEAKLKFDKDERVHNELSTKSAISERDSLEKELVMRREQLDDLQKLQEEMDAKSKSDIKVLVKEVKSLRTTQNELKDELNKVVKEKSELEIILQKEHKEKDRVALSRKKLLNECKVLRERLQECSVNFFSDTEDTIIVNSTSLADAMGLLTTSDNRIALLLAEAQLLAQDDETVVATAGKTGGDKSRGNAPINNGERNESMEENIRKMLSDILVDNAQFRKQVNSTIRCALKSSMKPDSDDNPTRGETTNSIRTVLNKFLERKTSV